MSEWEFKRCPPAKKGELSPCKRTYLPCWMALSVDNGGHLNDECLNHALFQPGHVVGGPRERVSSG
jgi:hypothetical protein